MILKRKIKYACVCICLIFSFTFTTSFYYEQKAYANTLALTGITSGIFSGTGSAITSTLSVAAPYALAVVVAGMAAGCVYKHRYEIYGFACGAIDYLQGVGEGIGQGIKATADGAVYLTGTAKSALVDYMDSLKQDCYQFKTFVRNVVVPAGQTVWTDFKVLLTPNIYFWLQGLKSCSNTRVCFKTDDGLILKGSRVGTVPRGIAYGNGYYWGDNSSIPNSYTGQSVCVGFENWGGYDDTVSMDHVVNYGCNSVCPSRTNAYSVDTPFANSVDPTRVLTNSVGLNAWDDVIGKTYNDVIGNTSADVVGNTGTAEMEKDIANDKPTTGDITGDVAITLDEAIANELAQEATASWDNPFRNSFKAMEQMNTTKGVPPVIYVNLHEFFGASTSRFISLNPFPNEDSVLIDFNMLNNYKFMGLPLIDFFRMIVGSGFVWTTFLYVWRKFTPDSIIQ